MPAETETPVLDKAAPEVPRHAPEGSTPEPQRTQIKTDDSKLVACYSNFARVTGTPEELILDFGLNAHPTAAPVETLAINQRIIVNYYTAKRLLAALSMSIQRHEAAFGVLETDVQKRVTPAARRATS